jgi:protein TonB
MVSGATAEFTALKFSTEDDSPLVVGVLDPAATECTSANPITLGPVPPTTRGGGPWPRNMPGFLAASLLLHLGALIVLANPLLQRRWQWELRLPQGHNSVALAASVASPQREAAMPVQILPPEIEAVDEPMTRHEQKLPDRTAAQFASAVRDVRIPLPRDEQRRDEADRPVPSEHTDAARPKRTAVHKLRPREVAVQVESPASNPSEAAAGVAEPSPPSEVIRVEPIYPAAAQAAGQQGVVRLYVRVDRRGMVVEANVAQSSGYPLLDQAALDVIYRWRFTPPDAQAAVAAEFIKPIVFNLRRR